MKKIFVVSLALFFVALACAPQSAPLPKPTAQPQNTLPLAPATAAPVSPGDQALVKLVEAAKKEGSVNLYSYNFIGDTALAMQRAFKARYGINVDVITGRGAEFTERIRTEARTGNRVGDFFEGSAAHVINLKNLGLTVSLKDLPVLQENKDIWRLDPSFVDLDYHVLAAYPIFMQPFINTRLIKPEDEPKSWFDLLQPKWKGKIVFNDPVVSSTPHLVFQPLVKAGVLTEDYIAKLGAQDLIFVTGAPEAMERLARGEAPIFLWTQAGVASNMVREGAPIKIIDFKEGIVGQAVTEAVVKDSPHPNAAKLFANWWLTQEGQTVFAKARGTSTIRKDAPADLPPALDVTPVKSIWVTAEDIDIQGKMFRDKIWVSLLKKGK